MSLRSGPTHCDHMSHTCGDMSHYKRNCVRPASGTSMRSPSAGLAVPQGKAAETFGGDEAERTSGRQARPVGRGVAVKSAGASVADAIRTPE